MLKPELKETDSIMRITSVHYFAEGLRALANGGTFENVRTRLIQAGKDETKSDIGISRTGYDTGRRLKFTDDYTYWTNARDVLTELMNLDFVENAPLPSKREYVGRFRNSAFKLTPKGKTLLEEMSEEYDLFRDRLLSEMYVHHPYMRKFLNRVASEDVFIPIYKIGGRVQTDRHVAVTEIIEDSCKWIAEQHIKGIDPVSAPKELAAFMNQRLTEKPELQSSNKELISALNDKVQQMCLVSDGLEFDNVTFDNLVKLCSDFWVVNNSFHVPSIEGLVVFSTAFIKEKADGNGFAIERRRLSTVMPQILSDIRDEFFARRKDFVPIHELRASVCYKLKINDEIFDHVLTGLYHGEYAESIDYTVVFLKDLFGAIPPSAEPLVIGSKRFYSMSLRRKNSREVS